METVLIGVEFCTRAKVDFLLKLLPRIAVMHIVYSVRVVHTFDKG